MTGKKSFSDIKIWGWRQSLIGDQIMALPLLNWAEKKWPGSFKYWHIARKCSQAAPLYYNHPLVNQIVISDCNEGFGPRDIEIAKSCDIVFNTMPSHPNGDVEWANIRDVYHETALMAGLSEEDYASISPEDKRPKLVKWFETERKTRAIAVWPFAGYGNIQKGRSRNPSYFWYCELVKRLSLEGYTVYQCGHNNDFYKEGGAITGAIDVRRLSFFEQIQFTLGCDLMIGTDSGSSLVVGAYELIPQVSLLTDCIPGHVQNLTALQTNSPLNKSFVEVGSADNIKIDQIIEHIKLMRSSIKI